MKFTNDGCDGALTPTLLQPLNFETRNEQIQFNRVRKLDLFRVHSRPLAGELVGNGQGRRLARIFICIPKGCLRIAQRFNVGWGVQTCVSPEGTADPESIISAVPTGLVAVGSLIPTLKRWAIFGRPFGTKFMGSNRRAFNHVLELKPIVFNDHCWVGLI
jgi:hypothetical protein